MIAKRVTFTKDPILGGEEPHVVITIDGWHDVVRFLLHAERGQCEFADLSRRAQASLSRHVGAKRYRQLVDHITGRVPWT